MKPKETLKSLPFILLSLTTFFVSCKKESLNQSVSITGQTRATVQSYPFTWDDITDYVPSSPANILYKPWASGSTKLDPNIVGDYLSKDGWVLIYCSFSPTTPITATPLQPLFFTLYNKYRGLLRYYLYQPATTVYSSYTNYGLALYGNQTSSMLNFDGQDIVDPTINISSVQKVYNVGTINSATGTWFAFQHEIAYDASVANYPFNPPGVNAGPSFGINWNAQFINVASLKIDGSLVGSLNGTITETGGSFNFLNAAIQGAVEAYGASDLVSGFIVSGEQSAIGNALGNTINGFFNAILPTTHNTVQNVDLKLNATINLSGSIVQGGGMVNQVYVLPGQPNSQTCTGLAPRPENNSLMGVFNLIKRPTVHVTSTKLSPPPTVPQWDWPASFYYLNTFTLDPSATVINGPVFVVNPALTNAGVSVQISKAEILLENAYHNDEFFKVNPVLENIGNVTVANVTYNNTADGIQWIYNTQSDGGGPALVRYTILVTSPSGSVSEIVKTFVANSVSP